MSDIQYNQAKNPAYRGDPPVPWLSLVMIVAVFMPTLHATPETQPDSPRERLLFNSGWLLFRNDPPDAGDSLVYERIKGAGPGEMRVVGISYTLADYDDSRRRTLNLPHDWGIEEPFYPELIGKTAKLPWFGVVWYRKHFTLPATDTAHCVYLDLDGVMAYATVWINGVFAGGWPYGYTPWRVDLTPYMKLGGKSTLAIRPDNPRESSRWYPDCGIYRNVWLVKTAPVHIAQWGVRVTTPVITNNSAVVNVAVTIDNKTGNKSEADIITKIYQADHVGLPVGQAILQSLPATARIEAGEQAWGSHSLVIPFPRLWSLETRNRYVAGTDITRDGAIIDRVRTPFGIRAIQHTASNGFLLNAKRVPIRDVCMHHDLGALGAAISLRAMERQLGVLHEMGCNAIRTSHNSPAPELLELCDRISFFVQAETFDCWASGKVRDDYSRIFPDWHEKDFRAMVRHDSNHPCVIQWSIGNEIREQGASGGCKIAVHLLAGIAREKNRSRPVVVGFNLIQSGHNGLMTAANILGYNYKPFEYSKIHPTHPQYPILGAEAASTISSRGEYVFPVSENKLEGRDKNTYQVSSYDLYAPKWGSTPDAEWRAQDENPSVMGEFVWTGFDYLGEPTPYTSDTTNLLNFTTAAEQVQVTKELDGLAKPRVPSRSSYFGIVDLAGFPKDRYYLYQSRWRPNLPMADILPYWNWPGREGQVTPVHVYTSGDEAVLFLNGNSLGRKKRGVFEYRFRWGDVVYSPGELKVAV